MSFEEFCEQGEAIDRLVQRRPVEAHAEYLRLLDRITATKTVDQYLLAKIVLSLLLAKIHLEDVTGAHALWRSADPKPKDLLGIGVMSLEQGVTSANDMALYNCISAFLHSTTAAADRSPSFAAVDKLMAAAVTLVQESQPNLLPVMFGNWRLFLIELQDGGDDPRHATTLQKAMQVSGVGTIADRIFFPTPDLWIPNGDPIAMVHPTGAITAPAPKAALDPPASKKPPGARTVDPVTLGEEADELSEQGRFADAAACHDQVLQALRDKPNRFLAVKVMLSVMVLAMRERDVERARTIWHGESGDPVLTEGNDAIDDLPRADLMIHGMMAMELRATERVAPNERAQALLETTAAVLEDARAVAPDRVTMVAGNAARLLASIFASTPPPPLVAELARLVGAPVKPAATIVYPRPGPWRR